MEEKVGEFWHKLITRASETRYPHASVALVDVEHITGVLFRALGGDGGLQVASADQTEHGARRTWLQRLAGSNRKATLAWRDDTYLRLPEQIDCFPEARLNRNLYLWLAALAVGDRGDRQEWFGKNQGLVKRALESFPGLVDRYTELVAQHLLQRPAPASLRGTEADAEIAIRAALDNPGSVDVLPDARRPPAPVPLWLHPAPPNVADAVAASDAETNDKARRDSKSRELERVRRRAERAAEPEQDRGLVTIRMENIFTWGEYVKVDRGSEDEEDLDRAEAIARDLEKLAVSRNGKSSAATLKFDLDLPAESEDDLVLDDGILLPEWDWRKRCLLPGHCRIVPMLAADAVACELPMQLRRTAKRLRDQFQALAPSRVWQRAQPDGEEVDIDAYMRFVADRAAGHAQGGDALYRAMRSGARDLSCLLMADLSLSTDTWVNDYHRVIDVIRDALFLFAESLAGTGDPFAIYGFSSRKRDPVRVHQIKSFAENYNGVVRGRINAVKPGYYTRMGAAIRYGSQLLAEQSGGRRLLLLLTDGKPNDLDRYEGRHGVEDTRQAIIEARQQGLEPFCVTIDRHANDYLPHIFGSGGYVIIREPSELPKRLPLLYARLTA